MTGITPSLAITRRAIAIRLATRLAAASGASQARDRVLVKAPRFARMSPSMLLDQFRSPERLTRHQARSRLFDLPTAEVVAATDAWLTYGLGATRRTYRPSW